MATKKPMTAVGWAACVEPEAMVQFLRGRASYRKLRLFACACCRRVWHLLTDRRSQEALEVIERFVDGLADREELAQAHRLARAAMEAEPGAGPPRAVVRAARACFPQEGWAGAMPSSWDEAEVWSAASRAREGTDGKVAQCHYLRDIFGDPFRAVTVSRAWLAWGGGIVARLGQAAYEERHLPAGTLDNDRLAVLADALEEAGCADPKLLGHLREPCPHVPGCWAVDALRGTE